MQTSQKIKILVSMENNKLFEKARNFVSAVTTVTTENSSLKRKYNRVINVLIATNVFYLSVLEIICLVVF